MLYLRFNMLLLVILFTCTFYNVPKYSQPAGCACHIRLSKLIKSVTLNKYLRPFWEKKKISCV